MITPDRPVLWTENLRVGYHPDRPLSPPLNLHLGGGELVALLGANGMGKSTLLRTLAGLLPSLAGTIHLGDRPLDCYSAAQRSRRIALVLTESLDLPAMTVGELVALGRYPYSSWWGTLGRGDRRAIRWALNALELQPLRRRAIAELSDGQRQKALIARALAQETPLLFLDEPTAFLDLPRRVGLMHTLRSLAHETGRSLLLSTHDLDLALHFCDRLWLLTPEGMAQGIPEDLVLQGDLARLFADSPWDFDPRRGHLLPPHPQRATIHLRGEGLAFQWTARALERMGYHVAPLAGEPCITISPGDPPWLWHWQEHTFTAIGPLLRHLADHLNC